MSGTQAQVVAEIPRLRRYARALTGDPTRADDLVQDCLERACTRLALWRHGSNMRAWLFTIMHNLFVNQIRREQHRAEVSLEQFPAEQPTSRPAHDASLELRDLDRALQRLSQEQREVLLLVGLEQFSYAEAARVLDIPIGTVMSRLSRARERLRELMNGEHPPLRRVK